MAYSVCRRIARSAAKNFYYGFAVLPPRKRNALTAVYAFMRRCDDIADDNTLSAAERQNKLTDWLDKVHRALAGQPTDDPVSAGADGCAAALSDPDRTSRPVGLWHGGGMDSCDNGSRTRPQRGHRGATLVARYKTFDDLQRYCYGVASVVGLVCIRIFGYRDPAAETLAERCGLAFQLTNIIRDVKEDAAMGRVYLPEEDLLQFGLQAGDLASPELSRLRPLLARKPTGPANVMRMAKNLYPWLVKTANPVCGS